MSNQRESHKMRLKKAADALYDREMGSPETRECLARDALGVEAQRWTAEIQRARSELEKSRDLIIQLNQELYGRRRLRSALGRIRDVLIQRLEHWARWR